MKTDLMRGSGDEPERETLRSMLRDWPVPGPPADLEQDLRRAFRRHRRSSRPQVLWLSLAAGLALVALLRVVPTGRPAPPVSLDGPAVTAQAQPRPSASPVSDRDANPAKVVEALAVRAPRARDSWPSQPDVIVEPGQAELLAQLGRGLRDVREAMPGTAVPRAETLSAGASDLPIQDTRVTDLPPYRTQWETVPGGWSFVQRSMPGTEVRE